MLSIVTGIANVLGVVNLAVSALKVVGKVLVELGKALGLIKEETNVEELGDKAIQSGYKPEDFSSYEEYVKAVENFELDEEKSKTISEEEKLKKGIELSAGVAIEKYKDFPMGELCVALGKNTEFFDGKMKEIGQLIKEDSGAIKGIVNYINGKERDAIRLEKTIDSLVEIEKKVNPKMSDIDAYEKVMKLGK